MGKPLVIRTVEEYVVENLGKVSKYTAIDSELALKEGVPITVYEGSAIFTTPMPNGQIGRIPIDFLIEASSIEDAFSNFAQQAENKFNEIIAEINKTKKQEVING